MKHAVYVRCVRSTKIVRLYSKDAEKEKYPLLCGSISLPKKRQVKGTVSSWPCRRTFFRVPHCVKQRSAFKEGNFVSTRNPRTTVRYNRQGAYLAVSLPTCKKSSPTNLPGGRKNYITNYETYFNYHESIYRYHKRYIVSTITKYFISHRRRIVHLPKKICRGTFSCRKIVVETDRDDRTGTYPTHKTSTHGSCCQVGQKCFRNDFLWMRAYTAQSRPGIFVNSCISCSSSPSSYYLKPALYQLLFFFLTLFATSPGADQPR